MRVAAILLLFASPSLASAIVYASGSWAAVDRGSSCEAGTRSIRIAAKGAVQARAGFAFDAGGPRHGQFFARLSRLPREGSTAILKIGDQPFLLVSRGDWAWSRNPSQDLAIIAAARSATSMRIESRAGNGRRFVDRYLLDGAPGAIDAAAARCAGKSVRP